VVTPCTEDRKVPTGENYAKNDKKPRLKKYRWRNQTRGVNWQKITVNRGGGGVGVSFKGGHQKTHPVCVSEVPRQELDFFNVGAENCVETYFTEEENARERPKRKRGGYPPFGKKKRPGEGL